MNGWFSYYFYKEPDIQETQMAMLLAMVSNGLGGKTKVTDYLLSNKNKPKVKSDDKIEIAGFRAISKEEFDKYLK